MRRSIIHAVVLGLGCVAVTNAFAIATSASPAARCGAKARAVRSCAALHRFTLDTEYYQNASRVGETNVAGYPEARLSYGVAPNVDVFYDAPNEIAESREGVPSYFMMPAGYGASYESALSQSFQYGFSGEAAPPNSALANPRLIPLSQFDALGNWTAGSHMEYGVTLGTLNFAPTTRHARHSSPVAGVSATRALGDKTFFTTGLDIQSRSFLGASAQSSGLFGVRQVLSEQMLLNVQAGSTFNSSARSKPHFIAFGVQLH